MMSVIVFITLFKPLSVLSIYSDMPSIWTCNRASNVYAAMPMTPLLRTPGNKQQAR